MRKRVYNVLFKVGEFLAHRVFEPFDDRFGKRAALIFSVAVTVWYVSWFLAAFLFGLIWLIGVGVAGILAAVAFLLLVSFYYHEDTKRIQREIDAIQRRIEAFEYIDYRG